MKHGEQGENVRMLQRKLIALGYPLPRWGDDGKCGDETLRAAFQCIVDLFPAFPVREYYADTATAMPNRWIQSILDAPLPGRPDWLYDVTMDHPVKFAYSYRRKISRIDAITLHQTACNLSERLKRWHFIPAHFGITKKGKAILINTLDVISHHGNRFNHRSAGIEISGNFRGLTGKAWTLWKPGGRRATLTGPQITAARNAVKWICDEVAKNGGKVTTILAHRQANDDKRGDPSQEIWEQVGMWAQGTLGLKNDPNHTKGSGLPIPREWDGRSSHGY
jgi:hypothetical protein